MKTAAPATAAHPSTRIDPRGLHANPGTKTGDVRHPAAHRPNNSGPAGVAIVEQKAAAELQTITPSNLELLRLAGRYSIPQEWYDET